MSRLKLVMVVSAIIFVLSASSIAYALIRKATEEKRMGYGRRASDINTTHGAPVGADYENGVFYCRDENGTRWLSNGECD